MPKIRKDTKLKCYIGIDPGLHGGIAYTICGMNAVTMPGTLKDIYDQIYWLSVNDCFAILEKVHSMPGQGVASTFKFGVGYGELLMALTASGIPFEEVDPRRWMKGLGIPSRNKNEDKKKFKLRLKAFAQKLFPKIDVTLETADAILIAEFCKRYHEGRLE